LLQLDFDFIGNGLDLPGVGAGCDDEKVGKRGDFAEIENLDILRLLGIGRLDCREPKILKSRLRLLRLE
jgi:hypothetical protein